MIWHLRWKISKNSHSNLHVLLMEAPWKRMKLVIHSKIKWKMTSQILWDTRTTNNSMSKPTSEIVLCIKSKVSNHKCKSLKKSAYFKNSFTLFENSSLERNCAQCLGTSRIHGRGGGRA